MKNRNEEVTITLSVSGCRAGGHPPVTLSGKEFDDLARRVKGKPKKDKPLTQNQRNAAALFMDFVDSSISRKPPA